MEAPGRQSEDYRHIRGGLLEQERLPSRTIEAQSVEGSGQIERGQSFRTRSAFIPDGIQIIIKSATVSVIRDDAHYFEPKDVYEVTGQQDGKPVLEPFDVQAAKDLLAKQKP
jgi:hypothetical protein